MLALTQLNETVQQRNAIICPSGGCSVGNGANSPRCRQSNGCAWPGEVLQSTPPRHHHLHNVIIQGQWRGTHNQAESKADDDFKDQQKTRASRRAVNGQRTTITMRSLCALYAPIMHPLCTHHAPCKRPLCALNAPSMHPLCALYARRTRALCALYMPSMRPRCALYEPTMHLYAPSMCRQYADYAPQSGEIELWLGAQVKMNCGGATRRK